MSLDIFKESGTPLDKQGFNWRELVQTPVSKLDDDAFTRVRVILLAGVEAEAVRFQHAAARMNADLQLQLARVRRVEHHQQTLVNWLLPADLSPLETTLVYEQVAIEVTASVAQKEPDPYLAQVYRFGLLEDFDHLYRYSALYDRVFGGDANSILQSYTDILPGRPTSVEHRAPDNDLRRPYRREEAAALSKLHANLIMGAEHQTHDYYMIIGPTFADPVARQLYAEIASIEEQHVTQYESIIDPTETWLEKWLMHEATEVYAYYSSMMQETNPRIRALWERMVSYELGHLHHVAELMKKHERRDPQQLLPSTLPAPVAFTSHRAFVRQVLREEVDLRARGTEIVPKQQEGEESLRYREQMNSTGCATDVVAAGYRWQAGGEVGAAAQALAAGNKATEVAS